MVKLFTCNPVSFGTIYYKTLLLNHTVCCIIVNPINIRRIIIEYLLNFWPQHSAININTFFLLYESVELSLIASSGKHHCFWTKRITIMPIASNKNKVIFVSRVTNWQCSWSKSVIAILKRRQMIAFKFLCFTKCVIIRIVYLYNL